MKTFFAAVDRTCVKAVQVSIFAFRMLLWRDL